MRYASSHLLPLILASAGLALAQGEYNRARVQALLPAPGQDAALLAWTRNAQVEVISERIAQAGRLNPVWFRAYFASVVPGSSPAYDSHLGDAGVSPEDYQLWLKFRNKISLQATGESVRLNVTRSGNKVVFGGAPGAEALKGLTLDLASGELRTPEGFSAKPRAVQVSADQDQFDIGARSGYGWTVQGSDPKTQNAIRATLNMFQLANGQVLLSYNRRSIVAGRLQADVDLNLLYGK